MSQKRGLKIVKCHVLGFFSSLLSSRFSLLHLNFINDVHCTAVFSLQIGATEHKCKSLLLDWLKETLTEVTDDILLFDLIQVLSDLLGKSESLFALSHKLLNLSQIVLGSAVLVFFDHLNAGSAVPMADVFDKVSAVANMLALKRVNEGARPVIETIRSTYLHKITVV